MSEVANPLGASKRYGMARYALIGVLFGGCFPLAAWILDILLHHLPYHWLSLRQIHRITPIHYIIDSAPLILGLTFSIKQARLQQQQTDLEKLVADRTAALLETEGAHEQLRQQQQFLCNVLDTDPNFIFVKDANGRFVLANKAIAHAYGTTVENLLGKTTADFNPDATQVAAYLESDRKMMASGQQVLLPAEHHTNAQGDLRWFQTVKRPIHVPGSGAIHVLGIATDITERKCAEEHLRQSEEQFRCAFEDAAIGMKVMDMQGKWLQVNEAFARMLGYTREEFMVTEQESISHPEDRATFWEWFQAVTERGHRKPFHQTKRYLHKEGNIVWGILNVAVTCDDDNLPLLLLGQIGEISIHLCSPVSGWVADSEVIQDKQRGCQTICSILPRNFNTE